MCSVSSFFLGLVTTTAKRKKVLTTNSRQQEIGMMCFRIKNAKIWKPEMKSLSHGYCVAAVARKNLGP